MSIGSRSRWCNAARATALVAIALAVASPSASARAGTTGTLSGIASSWDGVRVAHLTIVIANPVTGLLTTTTDDRGFFVIVSLPPGRYTFLRTRVGAEYFFDPNCLSVEVQADQVSEVHLWLDQEWISSTCGDDLEALRGLFIPAGTAFRGTVLGVQLLRPTT